MKCLGLLFLLGTSLGAQEISFHLPPPRPIAVQPALLEWQRQAVTACLVLEAACQGEAGMRAVMAVVRNRAQQSPARFAREVLRPRQFSAFNAVSAGHETLWKAVLRAQRDQSWPIAEQLVAEACLPGWKDSTHGATHYTRASERPYWAKDMHVTARIGDHVFYR